MYISRGSSLHKHIFNLHCRTCIYVCKVCSRNVLEKRKRGGRGGDEDKEAYNGVRKDNYYEVVRNKRQSSNPEIAHLSRSCESLDCWVTTQRRRFPTISVVQTRLPVPFFRRLVTSGARFCSKVGFNDLRTSKQKFSQTRLNIRTYSPMIFEILFIFSFAKNYLNSRDTYKKILI